MKTISGFTTKTAKHLMLDAGAFFKNFDVSKDTFATAKAAGKLLGATSGGGEFSAVPEIRQVEVDGVKGRAKGLETLDSWEVYIKATFIELSADVLATMLTTGKAEMVADVDSKVKGYTKITATQKIELTDYIDNIVWIGTLSGSDEPVIIEIRNGLDTDGLTLTFADKSETKSDATFYGHYSEEDIDNDTPPFTIYYPSVDAE